MIEPDDNNLSNTVDAVSKETKEKKIMLITNHSYMLYRFRRELISELMKENEVILAMPFVGHEDDFKAMGLKCIETKLDRRGINPVKDMKLIGAYFDILKSEKPDLVITYSIKPNIYAGFACGRLKIPFCTNVQGLGTAFQSKWLAPVVTLLYKMSFRKVRTVFFENEANADEFCRRRIVAKEKQVVLQGAGINLESYSCHEYPENSDRTHFLYLGRIMKEKGMDELFSAVERLHSEGYEFILDLVGFFEDEYKERVEQLQEKGIVVFHGFQSEPRPFYAASDCVVMPSYHEGMSNVLLEASAMGRAVITTDIPGCREAVDDGKTGILCKVMDSDSLYIAMKRYIEMPRAERIEMGKCARKKMEREFDKKRVVIKTIEALGI